MSCALLNITADKLMVDLNAFGLLFEALVEHDNQINEGTDNIIKVSADIVANGEKTLKTTGVIC